MPHGPAAPGTLSHPPHPPPTPPSLPPPPFQAAGAFEKVTGKFAKACLNIWDHSLVNPEAVSNLKVPSHAALGTAPGSFLSLYHPLPCLLVAPLLG